ncbi:hypothetical protein CANARDRAFT_179861, partial [[Candida] arabinofermentans NRRL YB-2248]
FPLVNPPNRVLQLDAKMLDNEVFSMLNKQLTEILNNSRLPPFLHKLNSTFSKELRLLLELIIFKLTIWDKNSSYGMILQNLVMFDGGDAEKRTKNELSKFKKVLLLLNIVVGHLFKRLESYLYSLDDDDLDDDIVNDPEVSVLKTKVKQMTRKLLRSLRDQLPRLQKLYTILSLSNFLVFLVKGNHPNLLTRILHIKYKALTSTQVSFASNPETISYEFQDRQLVWNTLTEFIVFIMPIISIPKFSKKLVRLVRSDDDSKSQLSEKESSKYKFLPERCCAICYQNSSNQAAPGVDVSVDDNLITNPHQASCGHLYCYYCIVSKLEEFKTLDSKDEEDKFWKCLRCGESIEFCKVYDGGCENFLNVKTQELSSDEEEQEDDEEDQEEDEEEHSDDDTTAESVSGSD